MSKEMTDKHAPKAKANAATNSAQKPNVVPLPKREAEPQPAAQASYWAREWLPISALAVIALPTLIIGLYLAFFASDRYAVEVQFAIRGQEVPVMDVAGIMNAFGGSPSQTASDSYIVSDYVMSRQLVEELDQIVDLRSIYRKSHIDFFSRLGADVSMERLVEYWRSMTTVYFDQTKSTISLEVSAYSPEDAKRIAEETLRLVRILVNRLSEESRNDALRGALADVERAEFRVRTMRDEMRRFREEQRIADPTTSAGSAQNLITSIQQEISQIDSQLGSARAFMDEDAPSIVVLRAQRESLVEQLRQARSEIDGSTRMEDGGSIATMLSRFEELEIEREFAQQAYSAALASLERARGEANRTQRYLAVFVSPHQPNEARYPLLFRGIMTVLAFSALAWILGILTYFGIREHSA